VYSYLVYFVFFYPCLLQVFFAVLIGAFALGQALPNAQNLITAAGSAGFIFKIIDRVRA